MIEDRDFPFSIFYPRLVSSLRAGTQCEFPSSKSEDQESRPFYESSISGQFSYSRVV